MVLIEGVGDEVTICLLVLLIVAVLALAWFSTSVSDLGTVNVIVVDRQGFQRLLQRISNLTGRNIQAVPQDGQQNQEADTPAASTPESGVEDVATAQNEDSESEPAEQAQADSGVSNDNISTEATSTAEVLSSQPTESSHVTELPDLSCVRDEAVNQSSTEDPQTVPETENILSRELLCKSRLAFFDKQTSNETVENIAEGDSNEPQLSVETSDGAESSPARDSELGAEAAAPVTSSVETPQPSSGDTSIPSIEDEEECLEGHIRIRLKYLNDTQRLVQAKPEDTIGEFKR